MQAIQSTTLQSEKALTAWFEKTISGLDVDQMMIETNTASTETKKFYNMMTNGNADEINHMARNSSTIYFIGNLLEKYMNELVSFKSLPLDLAFDLSDAKILVWAKIKDDDDATEDALLLAEARANASFSEHGFFISSTIVEQSDNLSVPPHYKQITIN
jgi:hypothetical protein